MARVVHYFLTFVFGLMGLLFVLRTIDRLLGGEGVMIVQVFFGVGALLLAGRSLRKARAASTTKDAQSLTRR